MAIGGNTGRYTLCPYYKWDYEARITCEDTYRHFEDLLERCAWMDMYCDNDWMKCPFAIDLTEAYAKLEKGDDRALENQKIEAMKKELKSMSTKLGMAEKKIERLQKKLDEEKELNKSWQRKSDEDEKKKRMFFDRMRKAQEERLTIEKNVYDEVEGLQTAYENRMKYLMSMTGGTFETFKESDVKQFCEENPRLILLGHYDDDENIVWELKEAPEEIVTDGSKDVSEEE